MSVPRALASGLLAAWPVLASAASTTDLPACPDTEGFRTLAASGNLYIGEGHGTEEVPPLVRCLVQAALDRRAGSLVVSLEIPDPDRPWGRDYWRTGRDGKASKAMWRLFEWLRAREVEGQLAIHYQYDNTRWTGQADHERHVGEGLRALMAQGHALIAYGGNFHSRREAVVALPGIVPTGAIVGPGLLHVDVEALEGGEEWDCRAEPELKDLPQCGAHPVAPLPLDLPGARPGDLVDGAAVGHDRIYLLRRVTVSPPQWP